ncbi:hypothetical protein ACFVU3_21135 [Streptomyces sp. NPDC058052]|uniref:hypothetical protein n=1 Tax=Streptomyces sp. NPDC058052 TaxID=3346316 RepID=UPI0036E1517E
MYSAEFSKGFDYELQNRQFALISMSGVARRLGRDPQVAFWGGYSELERFNVPRYEQAARKWGMNTEPTAWTKARGSLVGATPKFMLRSLLKFAYPRTVKYLDDLRRVRGAGPGDGRKFLDYMIDQEVVQIEMMRLALNQRFSEIAPELESFFRRYENEDLFS